MQLAPAHVISIAMAMFGLGLIVAAFVGEGFAAMRLFLGLALFIGALIVSGIQLLARNGASSKGEES